MQATDTVNAVGSSTGDPSTSRESSVDPDVSTLCSSSVSAIQVDGLDEGRSEGLVTGLDPVLVVSGVVASPATAEPSDSALRADSDDGAGTGAWAITRLPPGRRTEDDSWVASW